MEPLTQQATKSRVSLNDLNKQYEEGVSIDRRLFAEQRSNVLLYSGEHYSRSDSRIWGPIRESAKLDNSTKIRIVKNHVQKICNNKIDGILTYAPGVAIGPRNEKELQDQKSAELHHSVWSFLKDKNKLDEEIEHWAHDFVIQGEIFLKVFWNPFKGRIIAYNQATTKSGTPLWDEEPAEDGSTEGIPKQGKPIYSGALDYTRMYSFNMIRDSRARSINDSPWLCYQQLMPIEEAKRFCGGDPEKEKYVSGNEADSNDYIAFDIGDRRYVETKEQALILEWFYKPSPDFPNGYYVMSTKSGVIHEMELPGGIYPVIYAGYSEMSNTPRHYSPIKVMRPYQAEINRCASKIVEHQITLGDDKVISPLGGRMTQGATLPGIRHFQANGEPTVIPGRTGMQYMDWLNDSISELYQVSDEPEADDEKPVNLDAYTLLYRSMQQKKRHSKNASKFERFLKNVCETSLETYRFYAQEDDLIPVIGRTERVNITEFKNADPLFYQIKLSEQTEDAESKLGQTLQINQLMQYAGKNLTKQDLGRMMRNAPFTNKERMFEDWTLDYDNATNDVLALDRGQYPPARRYDDHEYQVKMLEARVSKSDYQFLHPHVQAQYDKKIDEHNQIIAYNAQQLQIAQSGFIPADGPLAPVDVYVQDPSSPEKTQRARVPIGALEWLIAKLQQQGINQQQLMQISKGGQVQLSGLISPPPGGAQRPMNNSAPSSEPIPMTQPYLSQPGGAHV